jgi:hypothetical protein
MQEKPCSAHSLRPYPLHEDDAKRRRSHRASRLKPKCPSVISLDGEPESDPLAHETFRVVKRYLRRSCRLEELLAWLAILSVYGRMISEEKRTGDQAAVYAAETGVSYEQALVDCNMD